MKFDEAMKTVAKNYATKTQSAETAASTDWVSLATQFGAIILPLIKNCLEERRNARKVGEFAQQRPMLARLAVRSRVMNHCNEVCETGYDARRMFRQQGQDMVDAIMDTVVDHDIEEVVSVIEDATS